MRTRLTALLLDTLLILLCLNLVIVLKGDNLVWFWQTKYKMVLLLLLLFHLTSFFFDKFNLRKRYGMKSTLLPIIYANLVFTGIASTLMIALGHLGVSRVILYGTIGLVTLLETAAGTLIASLRQIRKKNHTSFDLKPVLIYHSENDEIQIALQSKPSEPDETAGFTDSKEPNKSDTEQKDTKNRPRYGQLIQQTIIEEAGNNAFEFLKKHITFCNSTIVVKTGSYVNVRNLPAKHIKTIVNLELLNNIWRINKLLKAVNQQLPVGGLFIGIGETQCHRKKRFFRRYNFFPGKLLYILHYLFFRASPKLKITRNLYFKITGGRNRVLSRAEMLGRAYYCGFSIRHEKNVNGRLFFLAEKTNEPIKDIHPPYGPFIMLKRVGKNGKLINVYKLRSMYPYSEYLQSYIFRQNYLSDSGKFQDDFRVNTVGRIARKIWLDELPMLYNFIRGELKLVGVRPLSQHYYGLYPKELQEKRIQCKPGLIPPLLCRHARIF